MDLTPSNLHPLGARVIMARPNRDGVRLRGTVVAHTQDRGMAIRWDGLKRPGDGWDADDVRRLR